MTDEAPTSVSEMSDEQIGQNFPGEDVAHVRSMADKMAGVKPPVDSELPSDEDAEPTVEYPDYIPEKFRQGSVEDATAKLAQSYAELEKSRGKPAEESSDTPADTPAAEDGGEPAPVSMKDAIDEHAANDGKISDATYETLAKNGMSKELVDDYIAGQQAIANQFVTKIHEVAGGSDEYAALMDWAGNNWSDAEVDAYDAVISGGNEGSIRLAVNGLKAAYQAAEGTGPRLLSGDGEGSSDGHGYQSKAEMTADMRDPRYKTDAAFRKKVEQKLARGNVWGKR